MYIYLVKRLIDVLVSGILLLLTFPFLLIIALFLRVLQGSIFFIQERPGKAEKVFKLFKFKTMTDHKDEQGKLLPDAQRISKIGGLVRSTSIDELPQLWNVLKGDMSLIGPRPLLIKYLPLYTEQQKRRHEVKPGITGWAQVNGRNAISWEEKFELDVWYVRHASFALDMKILWLTLKKVVAREGVNATANHTMTPFEGSNLKSK